MLYCMEIYSMIYIFLITLFTNKNLNMLFALLLSTTQTYLYVGALCLIGFGLAIGSAKVGES